MESARACRAADHRRAGQNLPAPPDVARSAPRWRPGCGTRPPRRRPRRAPPRRRPRPERARTAARPRSPPRPAPPREPAPGPRRWSPAGEGTPGAPSPLSYGTVRRPPADSLGVTPGEHLPGELAIGGGTNGGGGVRGDRLTGDRGLREAHRASDPRVVDVVVERLDHTGQDLTAVDRARVVHRGEDPVELQVRVESLLDLLDGLRQQCDTTQGEELALQRDYHLVRGREGVDRQEAERGLT